MIPSWSVKEMHSVAPKTTISNPPIWAGLHTFPIISAHMADEASQHHSIAQYCRNQCVDQYSTCWYLNSSMAQGWGIHSGRSGSYLCTREVLDVVLVVFHIIGHCIVHVQDQIRYVFRSGTGRTKCRITIWQTNMCK